MSKSKRIVVTGIPGTGTTDFCAQYVGADPDRLRIRNYHLGDLLLKLAQETPQKPPVLAENLLNLHPEFLAALGDRAFDITRAMLDEEQGSFDRFVFDMHAQFFWNDVFINAYDWRHLRDLDPNLFITLIEKPSVIKERQLATLQGKLQDHGLRDLLLWQCLEANVTQGLAANFSVPHYVLPSRQDSLTIESLFKSAFLIYFQMPMTEASSEADAMITAFKERLLDLGRQLTGLPTPLIDPRTIDIETGADLSVEEKRAIRLHTIHRDLNWYIAEASDLVAYYPPGTSVSKGVSDETTRGFETGKNAFVIYPQAHSSPFMDIATKVFVSEEDFFDFFADYMEQRIKILNRNL